MFKTLADKFRKALRAQSESDFLAIPPKEVIDEMKKNGWDFQARNSGACNRYGTPILTNVFNVHSPEGQKLVIGKSPKLWERFKTERKTAFDTAFKPA